ncbi:MAG: hypothetical protein RIR11_3235 [Bacteroidota bacterium]|jgi:hypothetical protein
MKKYLTKFLFVFLCSLCYISSILGQTSRPTHGISFSYFNDQLLKPGARVGYEFPAWDRLEEKGTNKSTIKEFVVKINVGFHTHKRNSTAVYVNATIGYRLTTNAGLIIEPLHIGTGYMYSFLGANTYSVENSTIRRIKKAGNSAFLTPYLSLIGLGYDFRKKQNLPFSAYFSIDPYLRYPVNTKTKLTLSVPVGFTYFFK